MTGLLLALIALQGAIDCASDNQNSAENTLDLESSYWTSTSPRSQDLLPSMVDTVDPRSDTFQPNNQLQNGIFQATDQTFNSKGEFQYMSIPISKQSIIPKRQSTTVTPILKNEQTEESSSANSFLEEANNTSKIVRLTPIHITDSNNTNLTSLSNDHIDMPSVNTSGNQNKYYATTSGENTLSSVWNTATLNTFTDYVRIDSNTEKLPGTTKLSTGTFEVQANNINESGISISINNWKTKSQSEININNPSEDMGSDAGKTTTQFQLSYIKDADQTSQNSEITHTSSSSGYTINYVDEISSLYEATNVSDSNGNMTDGAGLSLSQVILTNNTNPINYTLNHIVHTYTQPDVTNITSYNNVDQTTQHSQAPINISYTNNTSNSTEAVPTNITSFINYTLKYVIQTNTQTQVTNITNYIYASQTTQHLHLRNNTSYTNKKLNGMRRTTQTVPTNIPSFINYTLNNSIQTNTQSQVANITNYIHSSQTTQNLQAPNNTSYTNNKSNGTHQTTEVVPTNIPSLINYTLNNSIQTNTQPQVTSNTSYNHVGATTKQSHVPSYTNYIRNKSNSSSQTITQSESINTNRFNSYTVSDSDRTIPPSKANSGMNINTSMPHNVDQTTLQLNSLYRTSTPTLTSGISKNSSKFPITNINLNFSNTTDNSNILLSNNATNFIHSTLANKITTNIARTHDKTENPSTNVTAVAYANSSLPKHHKGRNNWAFPSRIENNELFTLNDTTNSPKGMVTEGSELVKLDHTCNLTKNCHVDEICIKTPNGTFFCDCKINFQRNLTSGFCKVIPFGERDDQRLHNDAYKLQLGTIPTHVQWTEYSNTSITVTYQETHVRKQLQQVKNVRYKHWIDLTESERNGNAVTVEFKSRMNISEWFHYYDSSFRQLVVKAQVKNMRLSLETNHSTIGDNILYITPTPLRRDDAVLICFIVEPIINESILLLPGKQIVENLMAVKSDVEKTLHLDIESISIGLKSESMMDSPTCVQSYQLKSQEMKITSIIVLVSITALITLGITSTIHWCWKRRDSFEPESQVTEHWNSAQHFAAGHNLATDMLCRQGEQGNHDERSKTKHENAETVDSQSEDYDQCVVQLNDVDNYTDKLVIDDSRV